MKNTFLLQDGPEMTLFTHIFSHISHIRTFHFESGHYVEINVVWKQLFYATYVQEQTFLSNGARYRK